MRDFLLRANIFISGVLFLGICLFSYVNLRPTPFSGWPPIGWGVATFLTAGLVAGACFIALGLISTAISDD